jgi:hypothetical protein
MTFDFAGPLTREDEIALRPPRGVQKAQGLFGISEQALMLMRVASSSPRAAVHH